MEKFTLEDLEIKYTKNFSTRARRPRIRFSRNRGFMITVPESMKDSFDIDSFLEATSDWLRKRASELEEYKKNTPDRKFVDGEEFEILGEKYELVRGDFRGHSVEDGKIQISERYAETAEETKEAVEKQLREMARDIFTRKVEMFSEELGVEYNRIYIRDQKTKWGSCSGKDNINLNWRLLLGPEKILDYVIAHEVTHLKYRHHSKKFWDQVEEMIPDYRDRKRWLEEKSYLLEF
mgnify:CR=1 FL=1